MITHEQAVKQETITQPQTSNGLFQQQPYGLPDPRMAQVDRRRAANKVARRQRKVNARRV